MKARHGVRLAAVAAGVVLGLVAIATLVALDTVMVFVLSAVTQFN